MRHHFSRLKLPVFVFLLTAFALQGSAQSEWVGKLRQLKEKGDIKARISFIDKTLPEATEVDKPLLRMEKAMALEAQGQTADALAAYQEVLKNPGPLAEYAHLFAARLNAQQGQDDEAREHLNKLLDLSPNLQLQNEAKFEMAKLALKANKPKEAQKLLIVLEKKQRSEAIYGDILWTLATAERRLGNQGAFCKWIKKIFVQRPESSYLANWGAELSEQSFDGKSTGCQMSLEDRRKRIKNLQWAGLSQKALSEIEGMKSVKGEDPFDVIMLEASYHLHEGEVSEALAMLLPHYEKRKSNFPFMTTLATTAARAGESQLAVGSYYTAYKSSPRSKLGKQALYQAAFLSYQFQDYDGAARRFQEFMKVYPTSSLAKDARWHLAWIRYLRGDYEGSYKDLSALKNVSRKRRRSAAPTGMDRINYWMAMSLFRQGRYPDAKVAFEALVKNGGQSYYALASQQRLRKLESMLPKPRLRQAPMRQLARFSEDEFVVPWNSPPLPEDPESEETLQLNPLSSGSELSSDGGEDSEETTASTNGDGEAAGDQSRIEVADGDNAVEDVKGTFSSPALVARFERARALTILGLNDWAKWDLYDIERRTLNKEYLKKLMDEYESIGQFHRSASIAQNNFAGARNQYGIDGLRSVWQHAFPQAYKTQVSKWSNEFNVQQDLIWGIMRAESTYKRDVVSPVGAIGLMQIMPNTGQKISGVLLKEKNFVSQQLFEPDVSIRLGAKYLQRLLKQFDQNLALVAASYNAGPHRVRGWLASFGQLDMDEFIEHIPFLETRNYVKKVLANAWVYDQLYGNTTVNAKKEFFPVLAEPLKIRFQSMAPSKETWEDI